MTGTKKVTLSPDWAIDPQEAATRCEEFIRGVLAAAGRARLVLGLSGGIDSAVAAGLAARAIGPRNVTGLLMPYASSSPASVRDAVDTAGRLGIPTETVPITPMADAFLVAVGESDRVRRGNVMARCRMILLYDRSARDHALVLGTGNRTEALLGYTTHYGDDACGLNPIGQLYKTEIRLLARMLALPEALLAKAPSADLWEGQADEDELGFSYAEVDGLLHFMVDLGRDPRQLQALGYDPDLVERVRTRMRSMAFKRTLPPVAEFPGRPDPDRGGSGPAASRAGSGTDGGAS